MAFFKNVSSDLATFKVLQEVDGKNVEVGFPAKPGEVVEIPDGLAKLVPFLAPQLSPVTEEQATAPVADVKPAKK